jgi:hypothetical protein
MIDNMVYIIVSHWMVDVAAADIFHFFQSYHDSCGSKG